MRLTTTNMDDETVFNLTTNASMFRCPEFESPIVRRRRNELVVWRNVKRHDFTLMSFELPQRGPVRVAPYLQYEKGSTILLLHDEATASSSRVVIVSGSDERAGGNVLESAK